jgi:hypothetical protein
MFFSKHVAPSRRRRVASSSSRCRVSTQSASWLRRLGGTHRHELIVWGGDGFAEVSRRRKNAGGRNHCFLYAKEIGANFSTLSEQASKIQKVSAIFPKFRKSTTLDEQKGNVRRRR